MLTVAHFGRPGGVTSYQDSPESLETWTRPSSEPAQKTPGSCGDSANENTVQ